MNEPDFNLDRMREVVLKQEVIQYAKIETQLAKEELREHIRQDLRLFQDEIRRDRNENRQERRNFYAKVFIVAAFIIGGDIWTMWGVYQHAQQVLQAEIEKNRGIVAAVLEVETVKIRGQVQAVKDDVNHAQIVAARISTLADDSLKKVTEVTTQVETVKKQLAGALQIKNQLDTVKEEVTSTSRALQAQQKQLTDTAELVNALFSKTRTETFTSPVDSRRGLVLPVSERIFRQSPGAPKAIAFFLLQEPPIRQTLQMNWNGLVQSKGSYSLLDDFPNIIVFRLSESINFRDISVEVTYVPDKSVKVLAKNLSVKDGLPYADGKPIQEYRSFLSPNPREFEPIK